MKLSRSRIFVSAAPSVLLLASFYTLAFHMHQSLGGWPASIGTRGFPRLLAIHAGITSDLFALLFLSTILVVPVAVVVCIATSRLQNRAAYFAIHMLLFFTCWGLMQLAPVEFLYWWRD